MRDLLLDVNKDPNKNALKCYVLLTKDEKPICRTVCLDPPEKLPLRWNLCNIVARRKLHCLDGLFHCVLHPAAECSRDQKEWIRFLSYLHTRDMVAVANFELWQFYIHPPSEVSNFSPVRVVYHMEKTCNAFNVKSEACEVLRPISMKTLPSSGNPISLSKAINDYDYGKDVGVQGLRARSSTVAEDYCSPASKPSPGYGEHLGNESTSVTRSKHQPCPRKLDGSLEKNYVRADPSYLQTLGQAHSGWIFGAVAELVDNSRDAKATKLEISIEMIYYRKVGKNITMLSVIDDGHGMTHDEIVRMTYFGHKQPDTDDPDRIGRFGVGFKTGAMRLGRDALVLTQTANSRSVAFLSQSLNEGRDNLEIPVVSYYRKGQFMEVDTSVQSEALAKYNLKAIKEFSPFDKYLIGEKAGLFRDKCTGTQIYIWNLDEWGSNCCLELHHGLSGGSSFHQRDILIRSRRKRSRPGQISREVPLDYSLRSYLEVIFLVPRMRIYVQGSLVRCRPLAKYLNKTRVRYGTIMGKPVQLTLGRSQLEWEQMNCGVFLYWHGRLIEAYKRVGGMIYNGDVGRGVIGVVDVTEIMNDGKGRVWVHSNKQGFQDCEAYARLEEWLGTITDEYLDSNFDPLQLEKDSALYKPDYEWVQCDKCRKWRMLSSDFNSKNLPIEWFCYMTPFNGLCETPEQKIEQGVITVSAKRSRYDNKRQDSQCTDDVTIKTNGKGDEGSTSMGNDSPASKRIRRGLPRACKKI